MALARAVQPLLRLEVHEAPRRRSRGTTQSSAAICSSRRSRLVEDPAVGRGELRVAVQRPRLGHRQVHRRRGRPLVAEERLDVADRARDLRQDRIAVLRVADREAQHLARAAACRGRAASRASRRRRRARPPRAAPSPARARGRARRGSARSSPRAARRPARRGRRARSPAGQRSAGRSPPGPFRCGSTTCSVNPAATAASNALPPCSSTAIPAADASQCVEATMPKVPRSSGRVVNTALEPYLLGDEPDGAERRQRHAAPRTAGRARERPRPRRRRGCRRPSRRSAPSRC